MLKLESPIDDRPCCRLQGYEQYFYLLVMARRGGRRTGGVRSPQAPEKNVGSAYAIDQKRIAVRKIIAQGGRIAGFGRFTVWQHASPARLRTRSCRSDCLRGLTQATPFSWFGPFGFGHGTRFVTRKGYRRVHLNDLARGEETECRGRAQPVALTRSASVARACGKQPG